MREDIAGPQGASSRPMWETLEGMVREKAQEFIQQIMEEEVTELLGREKSECRSTVDSAEGYRNGYGKPRRLAMSSGTITLRRPRVRGVEERFESRVLPLFARRTKELDALLPELYLHGLAEGDFELAMRGLLGEGAPLSKSSIRRLRAGWTAEFEEWSQRRLEGREVVYVWADGIYVKAGLERDKAALLVVLGAMRDGTKSSLLIACRVLLEFFDPSFKIRATHDSNVPYRVDAGSPSRRVGQRGRDGRNRRVGGRLPSRSWRDQRILGSAASTVGATFGVRQACQSVEHNGVLGLYSCPRGWWIHRRA